jgi:hypothetical protein
MTLSTKPGMYLITPGGHVAIPDWYKPRVVSTMSIPGRRADRINEIEEIRFDPLV